MFGKKTRRIAELEAELKSVKGDIERFSPLVADFANRVDADIARTDALLPVDIDFILESAELEYRRQKFLDLFNRLPLEQRVNLLLENLPEQAKELVLHETIAGEIERANSHTDLDVLLERSRQELRIDISQVPIDSVVNINLNIASDFEDNISPKRIAKDYEPDAEIKAVHKGNGRYVIVSVDTYYNGDSVENISAGSELSFGMLAGSSIEHCVFYKASLYAAHLDRPAFRVICSNRSYKDLRLSRVIVDGNDAFFSTKRS